MSRFLAAFLVLVSMPMLSSSDALAKATISVKKPALVKPLNKTEVKKQEVAPASAQAQSVKTIVREQSAVVVDPNFSAPEGALYTTSDECG